MYHTEQLLLRIIILKAHTPQFTLCIPSGRRNPADPTKACSSLSHNSRPRPDRDKDGQGFCAHIHLQSPLRPGQAGDTPDRPQTARHVRNSMWQAGRAKCQAGVRLGQSCCPAMDAAMVYADPEMRAMHDAVREGWCRVCHPEGTGCPVASPELLPRGEILA